MRRYSCPALLLPTSRNGLASVKILIDVGIAFRFPMALGTYTPSALLIACLLVNGNGYPSVGFTETVKPIGEYRRDVKSFIQNSKETVDRSVRFGAIVDLCRLHDQIVNDHRFQTNRQLQGFRAISADRLKKCRKQIELEMLRSERLAKTPQKPTDSAAAQNRSRDGRQFRELPTESELDLETYNRWLVEDMYSITQISGGPIHIWNYVGGNYSGPLCDYGPELVRLIETTIDPDSWRTNGGEGVIYYYQPLRILVVNASSRIHDDVTDMLQALRMNNR